MRYARLTVLAIFVCGAAAAQTDVVRFDFESGDAQGWAVVDGQLDKIVNDRAESRNIPGMAYPKQGKFYINTLEKADGNYDDAMTGVIESPVFELTGAEITFAVGGGAHLDTYVALCDVSGEMLFRESGANSETMKRVRWDAREYVGRKVLVQVVDRNKGSWGHVTLDDFTAQGRVDAAATEASRKTFAEREARRAEFEKEHAARLAQARDRRREEMMADERLFARGETRVYAGDNLAAIALPVGGIGAGCILMDGQARRSDWLVFNNYASVFVPDSFFAVRAKAGDGEAVVRALQTEAVGPFAAMAKLSFRGEYPFGWYDFEDEGLPVRVQLEAFNPLIPFNARDSAIPCGVFSFTAENTSAAPVEVSFLATQKNMAGVAYTASGEKGAPTLQGGGNSNAVVKEEGVASLHMTSKDAADPRTAGDMALLARAPEAVVTASWGDLGALIAGFAADGTPDGPESAGPSEAPRTLNGALAVPFTLAPGEKRTVSFVLAWHFPNAKHGQGEWGGTGNRYAAWWPNALEVAREVSKRLPELEDATRRYHDAVYASNLPHWMIDRITSQVAILRSRTCFWTENGYFGAWEGCGTADGCCLGNCSHVWHYAQAHARLFPEIARRMREQELDHQTPDGGVPHRQAPGMIPAADGHLGTILGAYREYLCSGDRAWIDAEWPAVKKAMDFAITTWDADEDGVLAGSQWNTLDDALGGSTSWIGSLYVAALRACADLAGQQGDADGAALYAAIAGKGAPRQNETLWNGEYYIQLPDPEPRKDYNQGCHIDQVLGQWWSLQLGLGNVYPDDRVRTALQSLFRYNFRANFHGLLQAPRKFVDDNDAGLQMIQWPKGGRPAPEHCIYYGDEVMTGFEYSAAAAMIQAGLMKEGFTVVKAIADRYDGRLRTNLTPGDAASWGYSGNPFGDDECGKFYARAMSSWSLLLACQGFEYNGPKGIIGFDPKWQPENHASFFTTDNGYGVYTQRREGNAQTARLEMRSGTAKLATVRLAAIPGQKQARATLRGNAIEAPTRFEGGVVEIGLPADTTLNAGDILEINLQ